MYTEYVYENKKYEVAERNIKATLFDIVSTEESKISDLREKAFIEAKDQQVAAELQDLYVQQDTLLREIIAASDNLSKTLEKVDTCSRKLKQIENKNLAQIVATVHGDVNGMSQEAVQQQVTAEQQAMDTEENVVTEQQVKDEGDSLAAANDKEETLYKDDNNSVYADADGIVLVPNEKPAEENIAEQAQENETVKETSYNEENRVYQDDSTSIYIDGDEIVMVPNEKPESKTEEKTEEQTEGQVQESAPEMVATEEVNEAPQIVANAEEPVMAEEPIMTPVTEEAAPETIQTSEEQPVLVPEESAPVIQPAATDATSGLPLPFATEEVVPAIATDAYTPSMTLKKRSADPPKVIMISGTQASKLRASLPTQEALLSAKGMFQSAPTNDATLEQQLVNNGLLEPDASAKQAQIEQMMEQANALYAEGKIEESQDIYNQISALNKELQGESAGLAI